MSAILSADDLNDFISPGVACIKPVETLPPQKPEEQSNPYEVTTEDKLPPEAHPSAQISLTDCLACSGCVTSAEAVLVSLQSHAEVLQTLDSVPALHLSQSASQSSHVTTNGLINKTEDGTETAGAKLFVASVSPQVRASLAASFNTSEVEAGWMIEHLLSGPQGLASGGKHGNRFAWVVDTNAMREASLVLGADEVQDSLCNVSATQGASDTHVQKPILSSACPGWICYAEKTHPHILPHLSRLKSPQALTGTLLKTVLSKRLHIRPDHIWHVAVMPCFDKKLEASREELTDVHWRPPSASTPPVRDVDCVITARELLMLASTRNINFSRLPRHPLPQSSLIPFPDPTLSDFLFPNASRSRAQPPSAGTSGGFLHHILATQQSLHPASTVTTTRGRNADVLEYTLFDSEATPVFRAARYYGFLNIQNLVRKLKPAKKSRMPGARIPKKQNLGLNEYAYVEVMACPGGCTNGGGQLRAEDMDAADPNANIGKKEWLSRVDEAYFSMDDNDDDTLPPRTDTTTTTTTTTTITTTTPSSSTAAAAAAAPLPDDVVNGISPARIRSVLDYWAASTDVPLANLVRTAYVAVESDVGKAKKEGGGPAQVQRVAELAGRAGGGW